MKTRAPRLQDLWNNVPPGTAHFDAARLSGLPEPARRYLEHAITPGAPLASAVYLRMHGEIKLKGWCRFEAEQLICWQQGMIWQAAVHMHGLVIRGGDRFWNAQGVLSWKLFGILPLVRASGPDITRSAAGRVNIESIWLPSVLCQENVSWSAPDHTRFRARFHAHAETAEIDYTIDRGGKLVSVNMPRWGNPGGGAFHYVNCGGQVEEERTFDGFTIPSRLRVGWYFGSKRFEREGEFFRVTIDEALYR